MFFRAQVTRVSNGGVVHAQLTKNGKKVVLYPKRCMRVVHINSAISLEGINDEKPHSAAKRSGLVVDIVDGEIIGWGVESRAPSGKKNVRTK
jgi:hypothetical protein